MKLLIAFAAVTAVVVYAFPVYEDADTEWFKFKAAFGKVYKNIIEEKQRRLIFANNLQLIKQHNALYEKGESSYFLKVNQRTDRTVEERSILKGFKKSNLAGIDVETFQPDPNANVPDSINWKKQGAVTPVKNKYPFCQSSWAFSVIGALESAYFLKTGVLREISAQNLVDCSKNGGIDVCYRGDRPLAFEYIYDNDGIASEESYPYEGRKCSCRYDVAYNVTSVRGYGLVKEGAEDDLKAAIAALGPVSVAIDTSNDSFDFYGGGVYYEKYCENGHDALNYAVLVVGYGTENGEDYWLVKNCQGTDWGLQGYMLMARNRDNNCGVATEGVYPLLY